MTTKLLTIALVAAAGLTGCKELDCADGTIERNGSCEPAESTTSNAMCGPFTVLQGDKCVSMFPPTECDPSTTMSSVDPETGVTTCVGTGSGGGCNGTFTCPPPTAGKQTICGQLFDLETYTPFQASGATGARCQAGATDGPCALSISAYDALQFGANPMTAPQLAVGDLYIDDCGRYRVTDLTPPGGPFVGLGIDDSNAANRGPNGVTNTVGIAIGKQISMATKDIDGFIVKKSTTDGWTSSGGPPISGGIYVPIYRAHSMPTNRQTQAGVQFTKNGNPVPANDTYFPAAQANRTSVDTAATVTGVNGTALIINASVGDGPIYSGIGALPPECAWEPHAGASLANIVFVEIIRPTSALGQTCNL